LAGGGWPIGMRLSAIKPLSPPVWWVRNALKRITGGGLSPSLSSPPTLGCGWSPVSVDGHGGGNVGGWSVAQSPSALSAGRPGPPAGSGWAGSPAGRCWGTAVVPQGVDLWVPHVLSPVGFPLGGLAGRYSFTHHSGTVPSLRMRLSAIPGCRFPPAEGEWGEGGCSSVPSAGLVSPRLFPTQDQSESSTVFGIDPHCRWFRRSSGRL
jgi:hypothetical protein